MGNCFENCCPKRQYDPIPDKSTHNTSPRSPQENGHVQRIKDEHARADEEKRANAEKEKQEKLSKFLKTDNGTLSIDEQKARLDKAERDKQAKAEEEKQAKLKEFLKVDNGTALSIAERNEIARKNEQEKQQKLDEEKKASLAAFVAPTTPAAKEPIPAASAERLKTTNEKLEEAKRNKQNLEERLAKLKADRLKSKK